MAISKKHSRRIVVDGVVYRWRIPPKPNYDQGHFGQLVVTVWRDEEPNGCVLSLLGGDRPDNFHRAVGEVVTPRRIATAIRASLAAGWNPAEHRPGRVMRLTPVSGGT
jgi:hypothetical protein